MNSMPQATGAAERQGKIPRPGRYVAPEKQFSLVPERVQLDRSAGKPALQPFSVQQIIKNMNGLTYNGSSPSDSTIAVGPTHVVVAVNTTLGIYLKGGAKVSQTGFEAFFSNFDEVEGADFSTPSSRTISTVGTSS
jgi:hypothetical protein